MANQGIEISNQKLLECYDRLNLSRINQLSGQKSVTWEQLVTILSEFNITTLPKPSNLVRYLLI